MFQGVELLWWANVLKQEADHLWLEANQLEAEGLQQIEFAVVGRGAEALYDIIWGSLAHPNLSVSMGPPLPKRQKQSVTGTVASPTTQESEAITPKPEGGASVYKEEILAEMVPIRIYVSNTKWVYHCHVEGCTEGPSTSWAAICSPICQAHLGTKLSCTSCPQTIFNTDTLWCHGKWVQPFGFSDPVWVLLPYFTSPSNVIPISD